ncbi:hypothetical protein NO932_11765 [Pelagibacterium sp. 26DY04]|uniref:hypothetical protein n=1 Tax=Pelagibacterium sp. 26DY04 TaxID=2967130 RepID=UPI0028161398|nr:hypothetical protein [Pelagibacterium sp. 26DY04]WMT85605.1 hypothetical protein NO932_11765 [Pelagibacterium sp. 26DY04]
MAIEFRNGASVHQIWGDLAEGQCMASFQYFEHALMFAEAYMAGRPNESERLFVVSHYDGKSRMVGRIDPAHDAKMAS